MNTGNRSKILGTGLIALDLVVGPEPAPRIRNCTGGTCGNVLSILAYLGWDAYPIARVNGDTASERVCADLRRWGVHLDWIDCNPTAPTPIIVQRIRHGPAGRREHRFAWSCPTCGQSLPAYRAITVEAAERIRPGLGQASVFFFDRLSRGALRLAVEVAAHGALVVFEPSGSGNEKHVAEAIKVAHVIKYAADRMPGMRDAMSSGSATLLEIQTLGEEGLRYRHRLCRAISDWMHLGAVPVRYVADTCGCGDWCTAGLIDRVGSGGQARLRELGPRGVRDALRYGQVLAAWNCGFEGARGGMYAVARSAFRNQVADLLGGDLDNTPEAAAGNLPTGAVACPACPPWTPRLHGAALRRPEFWLQRDQPIGDSVEPTSADG